MKKPGIKLFTKNMPQIKFSIYKQNFHFKSVTKLQISRRKMHMNYVYITLGMTETVDDFRRTAAINDKTKNVKFR